MSSGYFGFFAHSGLVAALEEDGLFPQRVSGASAGAIVGGCWGAGLNSETIRNELLHLHRKDFWDPSWGAGLLRGKLFQQRLEQILPITDFQQCRFPVAISVYDVFAFTTHVLSTGNLPTAIRASCAVPIMFQPVWIDNRPYLDGGIRDHAGLCGVPQGERVFYHHLNSKRQGRDRGLTRYLRRSNIVTIVISDLPPVNPFRLECGRAAYQAAYQATRKALDTKIST